MAIYTNNNNKPKSTTKRKVLPIILSCVFAILLLNEIFNLIPFINQFLLGTFGLLSYVMLLCGTVISIMCALNKKIILPKHDLVYYILAFFVFVAIIHFATSIKLLGTYGEYLSSCYTFKYTGGGLLFGILVYPLYYLTHTVGTFVILSILLVIFATMIILRHIDNNAQNKVITKISTNMQTPSEELPSTNVQSVNNQFDNDIFISDEEEQKVIPVVDNEEVKKQQDKERAKRILGLYKENEVSNTDTEESSSVGTVAIFDPQKYGIDKSNKTPIFIHGDIEAPSKPKKEEVVEKKSKVSPEGRKYLDDIMGKANELTKSNSPDIYDENVTYDNYKENVNQIADETQNYEAQQTNNQQDNLDNDIDLDINTFDNNQEIENDSSDDYSTNNQSTDMDVSDTSSIVDYLNRVPNMHNVEDKPERTQSQTKNYGEQNKKSRVEPKKYVQDTLPIIQEPILAPEPKYAKPPKYNKPPIDLLSIYPVDTATFEEENIVKGDKLRDVLGQFGIDVVIKSITRGPAFTRYELLMPAGVSVKRVQSYESDIAMALESPAGIRLELPIPGKNAFGVEVPNEKTTIVGLRDVIESPAFQMSKSPLTVCLGKDITCSPVVACIDKMLHVLVAGATGTGKSVGLNSFLISLLYKASPDEVKLILIDPKRVEFVMYNGLPHMLIPNAINDTDKAIQALTWAVSEMEKRYDVFKNAHVRNIGEYNKTLDIVNGVKPKMYYIVIVVDELSDLMMKSKAEVEKNILRLTQLARAAGIHLIIATQRPSVDVITGTIKSNLPSRIAFAVTSYVDSKTILDAAGAENLLGKGDMLFYPQGAMDMKRIQGSYVSGEEVEAVVEYVKDNNVSDFDEAIEQEMFNDNPAGFSSESSGTGGSWDPLMKDACRSAITYKNISSSKLIRIFGIGYNRAARIVDQMVAAGFISEADNKNNRAIFITEQEFEERFGEDF